MKKISLFAAFITLVSLIPNMVVLADDIQDYYKTQYSDYYDAMYDAYDCGYICVYGENYGKTFKDPEISGDSYFAYEAVISLWQELSVSHDIPEVQNMINSICDNRNSSPHNCLVYNYDELEYAVNKKFNGSLEMWDLINTMPADYYLGANYAGYICFASFGRGQSDPGSYIVVDELNELTNKTAYCAWHIENDLTDVGYPSHEIYAVLERDSVNGKEFVTYKYLGVEPPANGGYDAAYDHNIKPETNEYADNDNYQLLPQDSFDQGIEPFVYRKNFSKLQFCMESDGKKTYHDLLKTDFLKTMDNLLLIFNIGRIEAGSAEHQRIVDQYGLLTPEVELHAIDIYKKDEINGLFNAYFGTNIDLMSLPDLYDGGYYCRTKVCGDYFVYYEDNNGYINFDTVDAKWCEGYRIGSADCWKWQFNDTISGTLSDYIYTVTVPQSLYGYEFPAIKYISFTPPPEELFESYANGDNSEKIVVIINGNEINFDQPPIMVNDRVLVPARAIFEALGMTVYWDDAAQTATAVKDGITITITIGDYAVYRNGERIDIDVPAMLISDRTLVPARAVSEGAGAVVDWQDATNTVIIN